MKKILLSLILLGGFTVYTPGELPKQIVETPGGGYTVYDPGKLPTTITPSPGGGYTIYEPGRLPTTVAPNPPVVHPLQPKPLWGN